MISQLRRGLENPGEWKRLPLAKYPAPQLIHVGNVISIELWAAPDTGQKIIDYIRANELLPYSITRTAAPPKTAVLAFAPPNVSGPAREFSAEDAEMRIAQFRISVNETMEDPPRFATASTGAMVWFSLPIHGRYCLSLTPHAALGFAKAGEVRGGVVTFTLDGATLKLECPLAIAPRRRLVQSLCAARSAMAADCAGSTQRDPIRECGDRGAYEIDAELVPKGRL